MTAAQDQRSLTDQLSDLVRIATEHGMYDAADHIRDDLRDSAWLRYVSANPDEYCEARNTRNNA